MKKTLFYLAAGMLLMVGIASCERNDIELTTPGGENGDTDTPDVPGEWVDLGLPSGLLWYSCNLGATTPEEYGDYYSWGEVQTKDIYFYTTYRWCDTGSWKFTKYCNNPERGHNGFTDMLTVLEPSDDVATVVLGDGAHIPTKEDWEELMENTSSGWTTQNGTNGWKFTAENGQSIFLPAAGNIVSFYDEYRNIITRLEGDVNYGWYQSSSLHPEYPNAYEYSFLYTGYQHVLANNGRIAGQTVRAVRNRQ